MVLTYISIIWPVYLFTVKLSVLCWILEREAEMVNYPCFVCSLSPGLWPALQLSWHNVTLSRRPGYRSISHHHNFISSWQYFCRIQDIFLCSIKVFLDFYVNIFSIFQYLDGLHWSQVSPDLGPGWHETWDDIKLFLTSQFSVSQLQLRFQWNGTHLHRTKTRYHTIIKTNN